MLVVVLWLSSALNKRIQAQETMPLNYQWKLLLNNTDYYIDGQSFKYQNMQ